MRKHLKSIFYKRKVFLLEWLSIASVLLGAVIITLKFIQTLHISWVLATAPFAIVPLLYLVVIVIFLVAMSRR